MLGRELIQILLCLSNCLLIQEGSVFGRDFYELWNAQCEHRSKGKHGFERFRRYKEKRLVGVSYALFGCAVGRVNEKYPLAAVSDESDVVHTLPPLLKMP